MFKFLVFIFIATFVLTQIILPITFGGKLFWMFRSSDLGDELDELKKHKDRNEKLRKQVDEYLTEDTPTSEVKTKSKTKQ